MAAEKGKEKGRKWEKMRKTRASWRSFPKLIFTIKIKVSFKVLVGLIYTQPHYKLLKKPTNPILLHGEFGKKYKKENKKGKRAAGKKGQDEQCQEL